MDYRKLFHENMLLQVYDPERKTYAKSILQEVNEDSIAIGVPMIRSDGVALREKEEYTFRAAREDGLYYFQSKVLGTKMSGNVLLYLISWPADIKRRQRRNYFRLPCNLQACYTVISEGAEFPADAKEKEGERGLVVNLSGGGLLLVTSRSLFPGTLLYLHLILQCKKGKKEMRLKGRVLRSSPLKVNNKTLRYRCGVEFVEISEKERDKIISFLFALMRERLS